MVRKRPLNSKEGQAQDVVEILDSKCLAVGEMKAKVDLTKYIEEHYFQFDNVFEHDQDNKQIYEQCVLPLVVETFKGAKTTCFAYGQTGSGKTHTMGTGYTIGVPFEEVGIVPRVFKFIFYELDVRRA